MPRLLGNQGDSVTRMTSSLFKGDLPMGVSLGGIYAKGWVRSPWHRAEWEVGKAAASRQVGIMTMCSVFWVIWPSTI